MTKKKAVRRATILALAFIIVVASAGAGLYWYESNKTCQSTSCQQIAIEAPPSVPPPPSGQGQTSSASTPSTNPTIGTAYFDVWANFSDGAPPLHFTKQAPLTASQQFLQVGGHNISAITVELRLTFTPSLPSTSSYSGIIMVYTCGACGNKQVYLGTVSVTGPVSKGILRSASFPPLAASTNLTILAYPAGVSVSTGGVKYILGMSPVVISSVSVNQYATKATTTSTSCPTTIPLWSAANPGPTWAPQQIGTATLLSAQAAAQALGVQSYTGLLATYSLGGLNIMNVIAPGLGGSSSNPGYGLLAGYHYLSDGDCVSY